MAFFFFFFFFFSKKPFGTLQVCCISNFTTLFFKLFLINSRKSLLLRLNFFKMRGILKCLFRLLDLDDTLQGRQLRHHDDWQDLVNALGKVSTLENFYLLWISVSKQAINSLGTISAYLSLSTHVSQTQHNYYYLPQPRSWEATIDAEGVHNNKIIFKAQKC